VARDALAAAVAGVWSEILGIDPELLGEDANFHQLGGNSVELLTMLATIGDRVGSESARASFEAAISALIRTPTLRRVSAAAHDACSGKSDRMPDAEQES
jgi:hypothetical protein